MIDGYCSTGMDNTIGYPGWMLGYWHGIVVAGGVDSLYSIPTDGRLNHRVEVVSGVLEEECAGLLRKFATPGPVANHAFRLD